MSPDQSEHTFRPFTRRALLGGSLAAASALLLTACGGSSNSGSTADAANVTTPQSPYLGTYLPRTFNKPDVTLTDTTGKPFNLAQRTAGRAMMLYFGYTHCPDVCPTTMGDLAAALTKLPAATQKQLDVVFISTDPTVDTPSTIRSWLDSFNPAFIGLTGDINTIIKAASSVGVYVAAPKPGQEPVHGAEVLGFFPSDNKAHVLYTSGAAVSDYAHDIPLLVKSVTA
ncbi:SCO family protein [Streptacidiphilus sp. 4-A2]|nr:SCO family protein [Streptacidiphilus sp. 4-A2]